MADYVCVRGYKRNYGYPRCDGRIERKISIISPICYYNERRFSDILKDVDGIPNKMLSKELKELETNKLIKRTVLDTQPVTVQYNLTEYGMT